MQQHKIMEARDRFSPNFRKFLSWTRKSTRKNSYKKVFSRGALSNSLKPSTGRDIIQLKSKIERKSDKNCEEITMFSSMSPLFSVVYEANYSTLDSPEDMTLSEELAHNWFLLKKPSLQIEESVVEKSATFSLRSELKENSSVKNGRTTESMGLKQTKIGKAYITSHDCSHLNTNYPTRSAVVRTLKLNDSEPISQENSVDEKGNMNCTIKMSQTTASNTEIPKESEPCAGCLSQVYCMDRLSTVSFVCHVRCFHCSTCQSILSLENFNVCKGAFYCEEHYLQLLKPTVIPDSQVKDCKVLEKFEIQNIPTELCYDTSLTQDGVLNSSSEVDKSNDIQLDTINEERSISALSRCHSVTNEVVKSNNFVPTGEQRRSIQNARQKFLLMEQQEQEQKRGQSVFSRVDNEVRQVWLTPDNEVVTTENSDRSFLAEEIRNQRRKTHSDVRSMVELWQRKEVNDGSSKGRKGGSSNKTDDTSKNRLRVMELKHQVQQPQDDYKSAILPNRTDEHPQKGILSEKIAFFQRTL